MRDDWQITFWIISRSRTHARPAPGLLSFEKCLVASRQRAQRTSRSKLLHEAVRIAVSSSLTRAVLASVSARSAAPRHV